MKKLISLIMSLVVVLSIMLVPVQASVASINYKMLIGTTKKLPNKLGGKTNELTWKSSNNSVATVSKEGIVTAVNKGSCTISCIRVITQSNSKNYTKQFNFSIKVPDLSWNNVSIRLVSKDVTKNSIDCLFSVKNASTCDINFSFKEDLRLKNTSGKLLGSGTIKDDNLGKGCTGLYNVSYNTGGIDFTSKDCEYRISDLKFFVNKTGRSLSKSNERSLETKLSVKTSRQTEKIVEEDLENSNDYVKKNKVSKKKYATAIVSYNLPRNYSEDRYNTDKDYKKWVNINYPNIKSGAKVKIIVMKGSKIIDTKVFDLKKALNRGGTDIFNLDVTSKVDKKISVNQLSVKYDLLKVYDSTSKASTDYKDSTPTTESTEPKNPTTSDSDDYFEEIDD